MDIKNVGNLSPYTNPKVQEGAKPQSADRSGSSSSSSAAGDTVSLSGEAKLRGAAYSEATKASDIREQKVKDLKERVKNGTYQPNLKKAAENLLREDMQIFGQ